MNEQELSEVKRIFQLAYQEASSDLASLQNMVERIVKESKSVLSLLRQGVDSASDAHVRDHLEKIALKYQLSLDNLLDCGTGIETLVGMARHDRYDSGLTAPTLAQMSTMPPEVQRRKIVGAMRLNALMTSRHMDWTAVLINFATLIRRFDDVQAILLRRQSLWPTVISVAKGVASDIVGMAVPMLGTLTAIADAQSPTIEKLLQEISQTDDLLARWKAVDLLLDEQIKLAAFTQELIALANATEVEFAKVFDELIAS